MDDFLESRFQIVFGVEDVQHLLLADTQALVGLGLAHDVLGVDTGVEALLVEVRSRFIVVKRFELLSNNSVLAEALLDVVLAQEALGVLEVLAELEESLLVLLELALFALVQFVLLLELLARFDFGGRGLGGDVEEIDVGLQVARLHQLDALGPGCNLLLQLEVVVFLLEVSAAASHILLVLGEAVGEGLLAVLFDDRGLGLVDELVPLLLLSFLENLPDLRMGVYDGNLLHIFKLFINKIKLYCYNLVLLFFENAMVAS